MGPKDKIINKLDDRIETVMDEWIVRSSTGARARKKSDIVEWLKNFQPAEIDDAMLILEKLQYKSDQEIRRAIQVLSGEIKTMFRGRLQQAKFFPLGNSPSSSGGMYLYDFRKELGLHESNSPASPFKEFKNEPVDIVFFDDMIGSGNQATKVCRDNLTDFKGACHYVCIFGFESEVQSVRNIAAFEHVICGIQLSDEERAFAENSQVFTDTAVRARLESLARGYGNKLYPLHPLGFDDSQALIVFPHNTPNNTLPIIWASPANEKKQGEIWNPVWERKKQPWSPKEEGGYGPDT
jgi:hypothetical protein